MQRIAPFSQALLRLLLGVLFLAVSFATNAPVTLAQGRLWVSPAAVQFGNVTVGSSNAVTLHMSNTGNANINFSSEYIKGSGFSVIGFKLPLTITPGHSVNVILSFSPTSASAFSGQLHWTNNAVSSPVSVALAGTGTAATVNPGVLSATPGTANFSSVPVGTSYTQSITLSNTGGSSTTISSYTVSGSTFTVKGLTVPQTVAAGGTATFQAVFSPTQSTSYTGAVNLVLSTNQKTLAVPLEGTGATGTRVLTVSPAALNFGSINVGAQTTAQVQVANLGNSTITVSQVTLTGSGFSASGISSGLQITSGQSAVLNVEFSPTATGAKSGTVTITSNASTPSTTISLSGSGVAASSHAVQLSWLASSSSSVVGYNVYRANGSSASFAKLNPAVIAGLAFADNTVQAGQTYLYEVTTVGSDGVESTPCQAVSATVP
jgi:Abnormal spindle-like microcephaly-assoc'd, ASPM-SPD-2-Hydin